MNNDEAMEYMKNIAIKARGLQKEIDEIANTVRTPQQIVADNVRLRGYLDPQKWSRNQLAARQVLKLIEEIGELSEHVTFQSGTFSEWTIGMASVNARASREAFDKDESDGAFLVYEKVVKELADIMVVVFVLAEIIGVDIIKLAMEKSSNDEKRGIRK